MAKDTGSSPALTTIKLLITSQKKLAKYFTIPTKSIIFI
jgi:hypothetical protein